MKLFKQDYISFDGSGAFVTASVDARESVVDDADVAYRLSRIAEEAAATDRMLDLPIPYSEGSALKLVHDFGQVMVEEFEARAVHIVAKVPARIAGRLMAYADDSTAA